MDCVYKDAINDTEWDIGDLAGKFECMPAIDIVVGGIGEDKS